jgi:hypothetical protein
LALVLVLAAAGGCKSARDKRDTRDLPSAAGNGGQLLLTDAGLRLVSDSGTVVLGDNAALPADFPRAVAVYPGAKVNMATRSNGTQGKPAWSVSLGTDDERAAVIAYYGAHMTGFTKASDMAMGDAQMTIWQSAQYDVTVMIAGGAGAAMGTSVTMTVASR